MSRRRLLVVLGAVVIVAAAVTMTLVLRARHTTRGQGSVDEVLRASVAALSAGDLDRLVALADPVGMFELAVTCGSDGDDDDDDDRHESDRDGEAREERAQRVAGRDPQTVLARTRTDFGPLVAAAKGRRIEVVAIRSSETSDVPRGAPMMAGCHARRAVRFVRPRVALRITEPGVPARDQDAVFVIAEIDGRFFLSLPPLIQSR